MNEEEEPAVMRAFHHFKLLLYVLKNVFGWICRMQNCSDDNIKPQGKCSGPPWELETNSAPLIVTSAFNG